ncbi:S-adenosyl-L-methionine-dependent methyltransferase [Sodiomyces alkalinus F11]|uniref:S-adenosyl-L-methionine-dependent methyltransferase n=1 Tax=Sodiomyces alkalinus (strain CBS 110278 / VKM F-3762 / F11) TaxID=1314773 RepID=A0A3N2PX48_SODAK|nr:S-adenosyl-L-methionine-dependent methyltransferase [Sodiomyces alkalinus F11]ROT39062.1 S-adenosyl-L-methionine-dependent methyltransferase [Sodiomyces alkalinus F11]
MTPASPESATKLPDAQESPPNSSPIEPEPEPEAETAQVATRDYNDDDDAANEDADSAIGADSILSSTASLTESILQYRQLHGRTYQSTKTTEYWAPNDDQQNDGLDIIHHALLRLFDDRLVLAPIGAHPQRVLDLGTGTGVWATDFGDQFPGAEVTGTDISPIQPTWVAPNVKFVIDDFLLEWTWPEDHFDLIHMRALYGVIPDLEDLYAKVLRRLRPGSGWVQHVEMEVKIESDHVRFPEDHIFNRWAALLYQAGEKMGRSFALAQGHTMKEAMERAGFVDVAEQKCKAPLHSWPKDPRLKEAGLYLQAAFDQSVEGFGMFLFTQVLGMDRDAALVLAAEMRRETRKKSNYHWFEVTAVYGRKP